jgi:hypothetical protein
MENFKPVRNVFINKEYQRKLEEDGYCLISLFSEQEIAELEKIYKSNLVGEQPAIELTLKSEDYDLKKRIAVGIASVISKKVLSLLNNYTFIFSGFIAKVPGRDNISALHQDPTVTDESIYTSINVWIPLTDVNERNGAVHVIKKSHLFYQGFRGHRIGDYDFMEVRKEVMRRFGTVVNMAKGQALIYDTRLFHYSNQNETDKTRIASASIMIPREATPIYYYHNQGKSTIDVYEISEEFFLNYVDRFFKGSVTSEKLLAELPYRAPQKIDLEKFAQMYEAHNPGVWKRLLKTIGLNLL